MHILPDKPDTFFVDEKSFERVYDLHWQRIFGIYYAQTRDMEIAREIVQDIFCSLWERRDSVNIEGPVENYLVKAAKYKIVDYYRSRKDKPVLRPHDEIFTIQNGDNFTENEVLYTALTEQVVESVDKLPLKCRQVYKLSRENGLSTRQIAEELMISEKTVKNQLTKALGFLRGELKEYQ